jgi:hypothetical protein
MGKNSFKNGQEVDFQFYATKNGQKYPSLGCLKRPHLENRLSVRAEILCGILKRIVFGLDGKNSFKNDLKVECQFSQTKTQQKRPFSGH